MIIVNDKNPLAQQITLLSHHAAMPKMQLTLHPLDIPMTALTINLAWTNAMTPACHVPITNAASAKTAQ